MQSVKELLDTEKLPKLDKAKELGLNIGKLYTEMGFPIDMALSRINATKTYKLAILSAALSWLIQHKRNSGAGENAILRQRKMNADILQRFIEKGEVGIY